MRTEAQWRKYLDALVDRANAGLRKAGLEQEAVADLLFAEVFERDAAAALDPEAHPTEAYLRLRERAGASLQLQPADVVTYLRIGALNEARADDAWLQMAWSKKALLVPLLELEDGKKLLAEGIALAGQPNVGVRHLRAWVYSKIPKRIGSPGRPRVTQLSLSSGTRLAQAGVQLKSVRQRRGFVAQLRKVPPKQRRALVKDLRETLEGLEALLGEIDAIEDEG